MQRSQSLSSCTRIVIRPDPKFSKFNPEDEEEEDMEDSDEDIFESNAGGGSCVQPPATSEFNSRSVPQPRFIAPPPPPPTTSASSSSSYNSRITVKRRPGRAGGLGPSHLGSLSNLTSVAEQPPTPCAVSHQPQQPLWPPKVLLSTPCIGIIREADHNSGGDAGLNSMTSTNLKRETLWMRRHSLHAQPQPLSVHGFGYGGHQADRHSGLSGHQADRLSELRQQQQQTADRSFSRRSSMTSLHLAHLASEKFLKRRSFDGSAGQQHRAGYHAGQPQPPSVMVTNPGMPVNSSRRLSSSSEDSRSAHRRISSPSYVQMDSNQVFVRPSSMTSVHANPGNTNHLRVGRVIY